MAPKLERTNSPGIFRRHKNGCARDGRCECSYVVTYLAQGRQRTQTFGTLAEAREAQRLAKRRAKLAHGHAAGLHSDEPRRECPECELERLQHEREEPLLHAYAREWVDRYQGTGRRGFREETRDDYRRVLERYTLQYFSADVKLGALTPRMVADYIGWLVRQEAQGRRGATLSDSSVRNAFKPLSACLATARREGLIRHNPAAEATLPHRPQLDEDEERVRPFPADAEGRPTMEMVVELVHSRHRLMFELLAATGVRRSELLALEGRHLQLDGGNPFIRVRQRVRRQKGKGLVLGALKSRYARRDLPISVELADRLRALKTPADRLVFRSQAGTVLDPDNLFDRVLSPACEEAGVEWAGFHTFRHTVASRLFAEGRNVVQVQRWLGHHSPSFTLDTYVHLLDGDLGTPLERRRVNVRSTTRPQTAGNATSAAEAEAAA
jgi:integrase